MPTASISLNFDIDLSQITHRSVLSKKQAAKKTLPTDGSFSQKMPLKHKLIKQFLKHSFMPSVKIFERFERFQKNFKGEIG